MAKQFQLNIPQPCHEDWERMLPADKGRFCNSCQKQVIDFTGMSDSQLIAFFRKPSTGSVCGRFMQDQLERSMILPKKRIPWLKYFFGVTIPALLVSQKVSAQGKVAITGDTIAVAQIRGQVISAVDKAEDLKDSVGRVIEGRVQDEDGTGIPYASIRIKGSTQGTATDASGNFRITYYGEKKIVILEVSYVGYETREIKVNMKQSSQSKINLKMKPQMLGEVVVTSTVCERKGTVVAGGVMSVRTSPISELRQKITDTVTKWFKIFPNPVMRGKTINIEWNKQEEGYYTLQLFDLSGRAVHQREIWIDAEARLLNFEIPQVAVGNYLLSLVNKETGKAYTEQVYVR